MGNNKENNLPRSTSIRGSDTVRVVQDGQSRQITVEKFAELFKSFLETQGIYGTGNEPSYTVLDEDDMASDSATLPPSQQSVVAWVEALDRDGYKGTIDCSANPLYPAANCGYRYVISAAGKIGGASGEVVQAQDMIICNTDGSSAGDQATVGANWDVIQGNLDFKDEDDMASDSATAVASQQSIKAYVDERATNELVLLTLSANQTGTFTANTTILQFDQIDGETNITLDTTTNIGRFTLPRGGKYFISGDFAAIHSAAGLTGVKLYRFTTTAGYVDSSGSGGTEVGSGGVVYSTTYSANDAGGGSAWGYWLDLTGEASDVEYGIMFDTASNTSQIFSARTFCKIEQIQ